MVVELMYSSGRLGHYLLSFGNDVLYSRVSIGVNAKKGGAIIGWAWLSSVGIPTNPTEAD